ncbi:MAG TPA: zinc ribbon domain-containing protein [Polyangiaceae bacterium]
MAKVTAKQCPKCGAPLALERGVSDLQCQYCGTVVHVEWDKKPPANPQPQQAATIYVAPSLPAFVPVLIALGVLIPIGGSLAAFFASGVTSVATNAFNAAGVQPPSVLTKSLPATCGLNQEITIVGQKFEGPGPLITGEVNCKVKIKDSTLKSDVVVFAKNLVEVTVENSTLEGKEAAVKLGMNSKLFGKKKSTFKGEEAAIVAGVNSEITLDDASVEGGEAGVQGDSNLKLYGTKSKIVGKEYGVRSGVNLEVNGKELTIQGTRAALEGNINLKLDLRGGLVQGDEAGVRMKSSNADIKLSKAAAIKGREVAIKTESNLELDMEDATVEGVEIGIETGVNPKLSLGPKAKVTAKRVAMKVGINLELDMRQATVESEQVAICAPFNVEIQARDSTIKGGVDAFRFERKPNQLELVTTNVTGKQSFNVRGCGALR